MGAIQNSLNSMIATIGAGAALGKHIMQQQQQLKSTEVAELASLEATVPKAEVEVAEAQEGVKKAETGLESVTHGYDPETHEALLFDKEGVGALNPLIEKARLGLMAAQGHLTSKQKQLELFKKRKEELSKKYGGEK